jgi:hypothetical protein
MSLQDSIKNLQSEYQHLEESMESFELPIDLSLTLWTRKTELLKIVKPHALNAEEVTKLYDAIKSLIKNNILLQKYVSNVNKFLECINSVDKIE